MDLAKVVVAALLHIVFALGLAVGGWGVWQVDHRPAITLTVPRWGLPPWTKVHITGLQALVDQRTSERDRALAQLASLTQQSAAKVAKAEQIASNAKASARKAQAKGRAVLTVPKSDDACAFAKQIDQAFIAGLQP